MAVFTLSFKCRIESGSSAASDELRKEEMILRLQRLSLLVPGHRLGDFLQQILKEIALWADEATIQVATDVLPLTLHADPATYEYHLEQFLSGHGISMAATKMIFDGILVYVSEPERERKLYITVNVDHIELNSTSTLEMKGEEVQDPPEDEICSICLDELRGGKMEEVDVACGHAYHDLCIYNWLANNTTCPLCRAFLDF